MISNSLSIWHAGRGGAGAGVAGVAGLISWYRADRGITLDTGVSAWASQAGSGGVPLVQAVPASQPSWDANGWSAGHPAVVADGIGDVLVSSSDEPVDAQQCVVAAAVRWAAAANTFAFGLGSAVSGDLGCASVAGGAGASQYALVRATSGGNRGSSLSLARDATVSALVVLEMDSAANVSRLTRRDAAGTVAATTTCSTGLSDYSRACVGGLLRGGAVSNHAAAAVAEIIVARTVADITALLDDMESRWPLS